MSEVAADRDQLLSLLDGTVSQAVLFFSGVDERFFDGHQTARAVLSHLVFWHREYCSITEAMLREKKLAFIKRNIS